MIRSFGSSSAAQAIDLDEQHVRAIELLRSKKQKSQSKAQQDVISQGFTWKSFIQGHEVLAKDEKEGKAIYDSLLKLVDTCLGGDMPSEVLYDSLRNIYSICAEAPAFTNSILEELRKGVILTMTKNQSFELYNQIQRIKQWKKSKAKLKGGALSSSASGSSSSIDLEREFGSNNQQLKKPKESEVFDMDDLIHALEGVPLFLPSSSSSSSSSSAIISSSGIPNGDAVDSSADAALAALLAAEEDGSDGMLMDGSEDEVGTATWARRLCVQALLPTYGELAVDVANRAVDLLLMPKKSEADLQIGLYDLMGDNGFEVISQLIPRRADIVRSQSGGAKKSGGRSGGGRSVGQLITITSTKEKELEKLLRKEEKRFGGLPSSSALSQQQQQQGVDPISWKLEREAQLAAGTSNNEKLFVSPTDELNALFERTIDYLPGGSKHTGTIAGGLVMHRKQGKGYTEVHVMPPVVTKQELAKDELVPVSAFDEWAQPAFAGFSHLNRIQSRLFPTAYRSNENMLVCAPTGAGKTNVAVMTMLHEISQHFARNGTLRREEFKIVYVAPMKALAAEMTANFAKRLNYLGIVVKEFTGDMQLTKKEVQETQVIVTTPEKWDVITRKTTDAGLTQLVKLLIIDEVHLLHEDRGPVIESLVARTIRQVETTQSMIRIVGLSATLPNYEDVAMFLRVNLKTGLFFFDGSYRPVPLTQQYIGISESNPSNKLKIMNELCFQKVVESLDQGHQVMVFVHSRKDTAKTAALLRDMALEQSGGRYLPLFSGSTNSLARKEFANARSPEVQELFESGLSIHHAGLLRSDRNLVEKWFAKGDIRVLFCTATLAWGVNLPAHTVVIKGTQLYDAKAGKFVELGMLDVMQIFGRAGRPQFDKSGEGIMLTSYEQLPRYLKLMNQAMPIESQLIKRLPDHLNAEIVLGTVTNIKEAILWLSYTYLYIRMCKNPLAYGVRYDERAEDPQLVAQRRKLIIDAAKGLDKAHMIRLDEGSGNLHVTDLGRIASHFYVQHETVGMYDEQLKPNMTEADVLAVVSSSHEFENVAVREEEMLELDLLMGTACPLPVKGGSENRHGKVNILLQAYISQASIEGFALVSDCNYIVQNASRLLRGIFEVTLKRGWTGCADRSLNLSKCIERRMWSHTQTVLRQFPQLPTEIFRRIESKSASLERIADLEPLELGALIQNSHYVPQIKKAVMQFPRLQMSAQIQPITRTILRVQLTVTTDFEWNDRVHGGAEPWHIWVEDSENEHIYHNEYFMVQKKTKDQAQVLNFTIPIFEPLPPQYFIRAVSDKWVGAETVLPIYFSHLILPEKQSPHTELLNLQPLPLTAIDVPEFRTLYTNRFTHFNPIQTQLFHNIYHTDVNVLLGAPTGSGKTIVAELAMMRCFKETPNMKVVYIAPLKALVRERMQDWTKRLCPLLNKRIVELTGDFTPDIQLLQRADIVVTTPEKWDGISRNWQQRSYVRDVALVIIDEIHLLGTDRGPILEVIVSRMRYIAWNTGRKVRLVGLSTALANARDLADWMGIEGERGLYNFRPSVRPVPLEVHIQGYPGRQYCPRMQTMNKPTYAAILQHSRKKPVLIFVSSRRQTRLTALDLITFSAADSPENGGRQWLHMSDEELNAIILSSNSISDASLKHTLSFGIGLHHAGLSDTDRSLVEDLFVGNKIQVLVTTSTLAWGVNFPAHLVVVKGTEYFDASTQRYVDYPITDVLQMMGRAGRPQFDDHGTAVILVHDPKKAFYKKFLYEPFPVESSLHTQLHEHLNAEVVSALIKKKQDAIDYLTWTYLFRRLVLNPSFYSSEIFGDSNVEAGNSVTISSSAESLFSSATSSASMKKNKVTSKDLQQMLTEFLSELTDKVMGDLEAAGCLTIEEADTDDDADGGKSEKSKKRHKKKELKRLEQEMRQKEEDFMPLSSANAMHKKQLKKRRQRELGLQAQQEMEDRSRNPLQQLSKQRQQQKQSQLAMVKKHVITPTTLGRITSYYYLSYKTAHLYNTCITSASASKLSTLALLRLLCDSHEYAELPVRHNEDKLNMELSTKSVPFEADALTCDSPHTKAFLLFQCHFSRLPLPIADYVTDTKSVLDNSIRLVQAMVDVCADRGLLQPALRCMSLLQSVMQARWHADSSLLVIPHLAEDKLSNLASIGLECLPQLLAMEPANVKRLLTCPLVGMNEKQATEAMRVVEKLPVIDMQVSAIDVVNKLKKATATAGARKKKIQDDGSSESSGDEEQESEEEAEVEEEEESREVELTVKLNRLNFNKATSKSMRAYAPRFPKPKDEGWWLVAGNAANDELLAVKRVSMREQVTTAKLRIPLPTASASAGASAAASTEVTIYFMSDCYIGLDQEVSITLES